LTPWASKIGILVAVLATASLGAQTVQDRGEAMLSHARAASDIRHKAAPGFRRKVEFSLIGDDLKPKEGTFTGVRAWRFSSATCDGHPIQVKSSAQIDFVLP
jgi:hypothetical protein